MKRPQFLIALLILPIILLVVFLYYHQTSLLEGFEAKTYDFRYAVLRGPVKSNPDIVIVSIDDTSLAELGRFPWSRKQFARFVDQTIDYGAKAVFLDVFFPEPESDKVDREFAEALNRSGVVTLATAFEFDADGTVARVTKSIPILQQASATYSHINLFPDRDGVVRWTPMLLSDGEQLVGSFALNAARTMLGAGQIEAGMYDVSLGERLIPTDGDYFNLINYTGPPGLFTRVSFVDVLEGRVPAEQLKDKLLLVGSTALGIYDMRVTPFSNNSPGVEVHANTIDSIIGERFMQRGGFEALVDLVAIVLLGVIVAFITLILRHSMSFPLVVLLFVIYSAGVFSAFKSGHWLSMVYPALSVILVYSATAYLRFFFLDRKVRQIRTMFSSYVSKRVVDRLLKDPSQATIGGETRAITLMFSDIENYTGFSEKLHPEEVVQTLNEYLAEMSHTILAHEGTLDKFMGDGIMSFWGAPVQQPDHAVQAVRCALEMLSKMESLRKRWHDTGKTPLRMRIGMNSGEAVVGNIGADNLKMEYTAIGDNVNLSARLEQINKLYRTNLIISEATYRLLPHEEFFCRELDFVRVVGSTRPMTIYEVLPEDKPWLNDYETAMNLYRQRDFSSAEGIFLRLAREIEDHPSHIIAERCKMYLADPPGEEWDGSHIFLRK